MTVTGPDFIALQVRDLAASADFYQKALGLKPAPAGAPGAVVFQTAPVPFAVREPLPGVDLDAASPRPGVGVALWLATDDLEGLQASLESAGATIVGQPAPTPFGLALTFLDPDGYAITVHQA